MTIPNLTMEEAANLLNDDILEHHGILGMKWGIRRFQKYPSDYHGDGRYIGPDGQPRKPTKKEARRDRRYQELKTKIDKWLVDAVETGDKKTLKRLKKTMTPQQYQNAYDALVKTGLQKAIKEGNKEGLKKYKDDVSKLEYKDAKVMADFNDAVNKLDTERMNKLVSKIKNEDIKDAAQRIATVTEFQNKKIGALKVESEMSAKLEKAGKTAANVAKIAKSAKDVYDVVAGVKKDMEDRQETLRKRNEEIAEKNEKKMVENIIKSGDEKAFEKYKNKFTNEQVKAFNERKFLEGKEDLVRAYLTGDSKTILEKAKVIDNLDSEKLNKMKANLKDLSYESKWNKQTLDAKNLEWQKLSDKTAELRKIRQDADKEYRDSIFDTAKLKQKGMSSEEIKEYQQQKLTEWKRANSACEALGLMSVKAEMDYNAYKAKDPTGETWSDALKKKSDAIKSSIAEWKYTPAAKQAKKETENAVKLAQDIQLEAAKKVYDLFNRDPDKFLSGEQMFIDPFKQANKRVDSLIHN